MSKGLSDDDKALFRSAVGEVDPINHDRVMPERRDVPIADQARRDDADVMGQLLAELGENEWLETGEHLAWSAPGVQKAVLRKLKAGRYSIQAETDLHGHTVQQAHVELSRFLAESQQRQKLCVRVVHGKGRRTAESAPKLKPAVNHWLQRDKRVLAFCSAPQHDGGTGATYVLLRRG